MFRVNVMPMPSRFFQINPRSVIGHAALTRTHNRAIDECQYICSWVDWKVSNSILEFTLRYIPSDKKPFSLVIC